MGVRPQFVKAAVFSPIIRKEHKEILIHTGQHYDENMSAVFFRELGLPDPDYVLKMNNITGVNADKARDACIQGLLPTSFFTSSANLEKVERMVRILVPVLKKEKVDAVLLYGDTNSTLSGALAAVIMKIPVIHVEAGERNGLVDNPEDQIRERVDQVSALLLCSTKQAMDNLRSECLHERAHFIGNLMEISFLCNISKPWKSNLVGLSKLSGQSIPIPHKYYLLTSHRQENSNEKNLTEILLAMEKLDYPVIYPVHPRNRTRVLKIYHDNKLNNIILTEPVGYFDSIHLIKNAETVITDSGGVLQEAHFAQTPYVFVMNIDRVPEKTRFDISRLARPERKEILDRLKQKQKFNKQNVLMNKPVVQLLEQFEHDVLTIFREFELKI